MLSLSEDTQSEVIKAFNSTSRCLDDLLNINNSSSESMIYETQQLVLYSYMSLCYTHKNICCSVLLCFVRLMCCSFLLCLI